jgi:hypothetical protein
LRNIQHDSIEIGRVQAFVLAKDNEQKKYLYKPNNIIKSFSDCLGRDRRSGQDRRKCSNNEYFLKTVWKEGVGKNGDIYMTM